MKSSIALTFALFALPFGAVGQEPVPGGPPINALRRVEPKKYEVSFDVLLGTVSHTIEKGIRGDFKFDEAPIVLPVIFQGAYSRTFPQNPTPDGFLHLNERPVHGVTKAIDEGKPFGTHHLRLVAPAHEGPSVRFGFTWLMQSWSSQINEPLAQQATWPRDMQWPSEVQDGLKPQTCIESDHPGFRQEIANLERNLGRRLTELPPYLAAKAVVAYVLNGFQMTGTGLYRGGLNELKGINVRGALAAANSRLANGRIAGTEHDLVCVCVAMLRAGGIPARPVVGIAEVLTSGTQRTEFISWAEFYLPGSGWVPFDPHAMLGRGAGQYGDPTRPWKDFGTMEELNERVPVAYHFHPPGHGLEVPARYAIWGWDPRPQPRQDSYEQTISLQITSRGRGIEDPR